METMGTEGPVQARRHDAVARYRRIRGGDRCCHLSDRESEHGQYQHQQGCIGTLWITLGYALLEHDYRSGPGRGWLHVLDTLITCARPASRCDTDPRRERHADAGRATAHDIECIGARHVVVISARLVNVESGFIVVSYTFAKPKPKPIDVVVVVHTAAPTHAAVHPDPGDPYLQVMDVAAQAQHRQVDMRRGRTDRYLHAESPRLRVNPHPRRFAERGRPQPRERLR